MVKNPVFSQTRFSRWKLTGKSLCRVIFYKKKLSLLFALALLLSLPLPQHILYSREHSQRLHFQAYFEFIINFNYLLLIQQLKQDNNTEHIQSNDRQSQQLGRTTGQGWPFPFLEYAPRFFEESNRRQHIPHVPPRTDQLVQGASSISISLLQQSYVVRAFRSLLARPTSRLLCQFRLGRSNKSSCIHRVVVLVVILVLLLLCCRRKCRRRTRAPHDTANNGTVLINLCVCVLLESFGFVFFDLCAFEIVIQFHKISKI